MPDEPQPEPPEPTPLTQVMSPERLLAMQRTAGNTAVAKFLRGERDD